MDVDAYLRRLGLARPIEPDLASLERLQRAHLTAVPFENLDVFARRPVATDQSWVVDKVVERGRGGWCFELNGAFAALLEALGYEVTRLAATVLLGSGAPMPTHLALEVALDRPYLVDVGFGDTFIRPLAMDTDQPQDGGTGEFSLIDEDGTWTLVSHGADGARVGEYVFDRKDHKLTDFEEASLHLRTTPGLQWTATRFATRLLDYGPDRVTLLSDRIKLRRNGVWTEEAVTDEQWASLLDEWFALTP